MPQKSRRAFLRQASTAEMAAALVEYCNLEKGTKRSELRRQHEIEKPHNVPAPCPLIYGHSVGTVIIIAFGISQPIQLFLQFQHSLPGCPFGSERVL